MNVDSEEVKGYQSISVSTSNEGDFVNFNNNSGTNDDLKQEELCHNHLSQATDIDSCSTNVANNDMAVTKNNNSKKKIIYRKRPNSTHEIDHNSASSVSKVIDIGSTASSNDNSSNIVVASSTADATGCGGVDLSITHQRPSRNKIRPTIYSGAEYNKQMSINDKEDDANIDANISDSSADGSSCSSNNSKVSNKRNRTPTAAEDDANADVKVKKPRSSNKKSNRTSNRWQHNYLALLEYDKQFGTASIPHKHSYECTLVGMGENGEDIHYEGHLGEWLNRQRKAKKGREKSGKLTPERDALLQQLVDQGKISWDATSNCITFKRKLQGDINWPMNYNALLEYYKEHGTCNVPGSCKYEYTLVGMGENGEDLHFKGQLGKWLNRQRLAKRGKCSFKITPEREALLQQLVDEGHFRWDIVSMAKKSVQSETDTTTTMVIV